jgi:predicted transcriptional regulator
MYKCYIADMLNIVIINCITKTALTYVCNLAGTDYELPEDYTTVSKHVAAVQ